MKKNIVIVGDGMSGKTCLLVVFGKGGFPTGYVPTVYDTSVVTTTVDGVEASNLSLVVMPATVVVVVGWWMVVVEVQEI